MVTFVIPNLDKALAINPNDVTALTNKDTALLNLGKSNESIAYFDKALAINPNNVNTLTQKGLALPRHCFAHREFNDTEGMNTILILAHDLQVQIL